MLPSGRSRSTHTLADACPVLAVPGPSRVRRLRGWLRLSLAGSPDQHAVSSSLSFGTNLPPRAAPHPVLRRRSCLRLPRDFCLRGGYDFHILSSWFHGRTSAASSRRFRRADPSARSHPTARSHSRQPVGQRMMQSKQGDAAGSVVQSGDKSPHSISASAFSPPFRIPQSPLRNPFTPPAISSTPPAPFATDRPPSPTPTTVVRLRAAASS